MKHIHALLAGAALACLGSCSPPQANIDSSLVAAPSSAAPVPPPVIAAPPGAAGATMDAAKTLSVGMADIGAFTAPDAKSAFYRFDNKLKVRDLAIVRLENQSSTLKPDFKLYDFNKSQVGEKYDGTAGASVELPISVEPNQSFYVEVLPYNSIGKYKLSVTMQNAADQFEPNDDVLSAAAVNVGKDAVGAIMDEKDNDYFRFSGATKANLTVTLDNQSATLKPDIKIYDANKSQLMEKYDGTAGANLTFPINVEAGKDFYVQVVPNASTGKYKLTVK